MSIGIAGYLNAGVEVQRLQKEKQTERSGSDFSSYKKSDPAGRLSGNRRDVYIRSRQSYLEENGKDTKAAGNAADPSGSAGASETAGKSEVLQTLSTDAKTGDASGKNAVKQALNAANSTTAADTNTASAKDVLKMSAKERASLVNRLMEEQEQQTRQFVQMVRKSLGYQASAFENANATPSVDNNGIWHFFSSGNYTVDPATKLEAEASIREDGHYGVKQTSERLFNFAAAAVGDDPARMKQMQSAIQDGFRQAKAAWGQDLPGICNDTIDATNKLFQDYYDSHDGKGSETT